MKRFRLPLPHKPARQRFYDQKGRARFRGIAWTITFEEWYQWWLDHGIDKDYPTPNEKNQLCMCRKGDQGPYSLDNVYCGTRSQNTKERNITRPNLGHKGKFGYQHPRHKMIPKSAKAIATPVGIFFSMSAVYKHFGFKVDHLKSLMKKNPNHWYFVKES